MTINIAGNWGEFYCNIVTDGDNASIVMQDASGIIARKGKVTTKGNDKVAVKTKITETTERYDKDGKLVEKITREEESEDDTVYDGLPWHTPTYGHCCCESGNET